MPGPLKPPPDRDIAYRLRSSSIGAAGVALLLVVFSNVAWITGEVDGLTGFVMVLLAALLLGWALGDFVAARRYIRSRGEE